MITKSCRLQWYRFGGCEAISHGLQLSLCNTQPCGSEMFGEYESVRFQSCQKTDVPFPSLQSVLYRLRVMQVTSYEVKVDGDRCRR